MVGLTAASISRYENSKLAARRTVLKAFLRLAETEEEKAPLLAALASEPVDQAAGEPENPIAALRLLRGTSKERFAREIGTTVAELNRLEEGGGNLRPDVLENLKTISARVRRPDLGVRLTSEEWKVQTVIYPMKEKHVKVTEPVLNPDKAFWHGLLEEVLDSQEQDAIVAVQHNLMVFGRYVRTKRGLGANKRSG